MTSVQVKICGITSVSDAKLCMKAGADALGLVFFPKSPRNVSPDTARTIALAVKNQVAVTGVFVNEPLSSLLSIANACRLDAVQLHGSESPDYVSTLAAALGPSPTRIIKCLYLESQPDVTLADTYPADAFLIECAKGVLPGGNAMDWNFKRAGNLILDKPCIIAGGLSPVNIEQAIEAALPDAVDVSSGVEATPGIKDPAKVARFIRLAKNKTIAKTLRRVF